MSLVHLPWRDAAFLVLLIGLTGQNGGTIADAPAAHHRADAGAGGTATAIVELRKPRRGKRRSHMDVPLVDLPDWVAVDQVAAGTITAKDELHSPFGVYMLLLELSEPARRLAGSDRLLVSWTCTGGGGIGGFRVGLVKHMVPTWGAEKAIAADPQPGKQAADPGVLEVNMARLRLTYLELHQTAVAHTEQVLANEYLGRNRGNLVAYQQLVARVLDERVAAAKASVLLATLDETPACPGRSSRPPSTTSGSSSTTQNRPFCGARSDRGWRWAPLRTTSRPSQDLDVYLADLLVAPAGTRVRAGRINEVRRLWSYRELLPPAGRPPPTPPWQGDDAAAILGRRRHGLENRTPRIHPDTMDRLLCWALRFVEMFAEDILAAHYEHAMLALRSDRARGRGEWPAPDRGWGGVHRDLHALLGGCGPAACRCPAGHSPMVAVWSTGGTWRVC
jgi:hypothetical protein